MKNKLWKIALRLPHGSLNDLQLLETAKMNDVVSAAEPELRYLVAWHMLRWTNHLGYQYSSTWAIDEDIERRAHEIVANID